MPRPIRMYQNKSSHERLLYNAMYSIKELSMILGIKEKSLRNRIQSSDIVNDDHVKPIGNYNFHSSPWALYESKTDEMSGQYLRRPLL